MGKKGSKDVPEGSQGSPPDKPEKPEKPDKPEKPEKPEKSTAATEDPQSSLTDGNASFLRAARAGNLDKVLDYLKGSTDINTSNANGLNALHLSSKEGHLNIVTELLKRGANVDAATKKGNTALHIASLAGQEAIVKVLVEYGANVNVQSQNGFTPLYMAAQENHVSVVKFLLSHGANQNLATEDGFTPLAVALQQGHDKVVAVLLENDRAGKTRLPALHIAARKDDTKAAALLLQNGHNPDVTSKSGFTPLHIAAHYGHVNVATLLLQRGASVDYAARNNITPLHVASKWGRVNMVNTLLDRGARIDAKTRDGLTPLHCSARSGHDQCVDQLLERGAPIAAKTKNGLAPLHMAAQGDHVDSARLLLYHKATVDDVTVDYLTPLHVAAHCGHHRVAKLLLDRKANPSARALNGFTPLHIACKKNRLKVIELLIKYGASIHGTTESGLTPLHVAAFMGNLNIAMFLLNHEAKVDEVNVRGETPMHLAARSNQIDLIKLLLRHNATVDAKAHEKQTPLHIAARLGNVEIVTLLLENKANPDAQTRDLYTALHIASREGKEDVAAVLLDHKASLAMKTKKEFTPLHVAAKHGRLGVAALLLRHLASPDATAQNGLTPLHIAAHYDNVEVAMLLLDQGASPHTAAQNGFTPLHIAAKKNQMDVATTLLEYGADPNAMTKHGISPVHLAAQEGHTDMLSLLLERGAKPDVSAKNGLTPLHLVAQEDQLNCAVILLKNGATVDPPSKAGYTPLHVACHYGNHKTAAFLLNHGAAIDAKTKHGLTPLHQAAQQGHAAVINQLLQKGADPNETANNGYTALGIAKRFGYISVVNTLTTVTTIETTTVTSPTDEKLKVQVPETMQVTFMTDSEDEGDDISMTGDQSLLTPQEIKTMGDDSMPVDNRKTWEDNWLVSGDPQMSYYTGPGSLSGHYKGGNSMPGHYGNTLSPGGFPGNTSRVSTLSRDLAVPLDCPEESMVDGELIIPQAEITVESSAPLMASTPMRPITTVDGRTVHPGEPFYDQDGKTIDGMVYGPDGTAVPATLDNIPLTATIPIFAGFLISFMVDARGGTMRSCRLPGLRVVVPPQRASGPTRVTCRLIKRNKLQTPPPLMENEALATRVIEVAPPNTQFLGPVLIEVPHFASLRGKEREIVILRSENGEQWKEHALDAREDDVDKALEGYKGDVDNENEKVLAANKRICRILTKDFPQFFAVISRVRQETNTIGPSGGMLSSTVVPQVQAVFPEGTLQKKIKVGLQAQPVGGDVVKKVLGNRVMVSPIVTIEPRRRKFHKPITVTIPVPTAYNQGVINNYGGDTPTLRLLCSITGGTAPAQWEDITGTTPLTFVNDCVSFTTTVSARFWLMDCKEIDQASNFSRDLYLELKAVPFMAKFVVFSKTHDPIESRVRVFCMTDNRLDKTLEQQENFKEVAHSKDVEVLDGRPVFIEMAGNLTNVQKSGDQLHINFFAFHENRQPFFVRVRDQSQEACGRLSFMREPKVHRGMPPQKPICNLNITMPPFVKVKKATESESETESSEDEDYRMEKGEREQFEQKEEKITEEETEPSNLNFASIKLRKKYNFLQDPSMSPTSAHMKAELRLMMVAEEIGSDWKPLGRELDVSDKDLQTIEEENDDQKEKAFVTLHEWAEKNGKDATSEKLSEALNRIGRNDVADNCLGAYINLDVTREQGDETQELPHVAEGEAEAFFGGKLDKQEFAQFKQELDKLSPDEEKDDVTEDMTGPAVEEDSFTPMQWEKKEEEPTKAMDPADIAAFADALNELAVDQPMDTDDDDSSPVGDQPITEEDMVANKAPPPEESAVNLSTLDGDDAPQPEDGEEEEPSEYAGMAQVDEGLSAPESKGEVEHKKPSSFDPADLDTLTVVMNEYAEATTPHSEPEDDDAPPVPMAEPPIEEDSMVAEESAPPRPEGELHQLLPGEELPDDEVEEVVEEFEETLEDGTVRKVTRKRIIKRTYQMVEVDPNDPDAIPEGFDGDDVHSP